MVTANVLYLSQHDTLDAIRSYMRTLPVGTQLWLVAPILSRTFDSLVNLKLLKRAADAAALDLRLVSLRGPVRLLSREADIPTYLFLPLGLVSTTKRTLRGSMTERQYQVSERRARFYADKPLVRGFSAATLTLAATVLVIAIVGMAAAVFVPSATINLRPVTARVAGYFPVQADTRFQEPDLERLVIPARSLELVVDGHGDIATTGRSDIPDGVAEGSVVFTNKTGDEVAIPVGTIVRTAGEVPARFRTTETVSVAGGEGNTVRAAVVSVDPGPSGNVDAQTIKEVEGVLGTQVIVDNDAPTGGGSLRSVATVGFDDFNRLRTQLSNQLRQQAFDSINANLAESEYVPPSTVEVQILSQTGDQVVDQQAERLGMTMKLRVRAMAVDVESLRLIAKAFLEHQAGGTGEVILDSVDVQLSGEVRTVGTALEFGAQASGELGPRIDVEAVRQEIQRKTPDEAAQLLSEEYQLAAPTEIILEPDWWPFLPIIDQRLKIFVLAPKP
ncbi:MAG: hypothetical protein GXY52_08980 [Chloroflexi bacterium]|nr:hypothetical protein [Chloroflexota bacterium]